MFSFGVAHLDPFFDYWVAFQKVNKLQFGAKKGALYGQKTSFFDSTLYLRHYFIASYMVCHLFLDRYENVYIGRQGHCSWRIFQGGDNMHWQESIHACGENSIPGTFILIIMGEKVEIIYFLDIW